MEFVLFFGNFCESDVVEFYDYVGGFGGLVVGGGGGVRVVGFGVVEEWVCV